MLMLRNTHDTFQISETPEITVRRPVVGTYIIQTTIADFIALGSLEPLYEPFTSPHYVERDAYPKIEYEMDQSKVSETVQFTITFKEKYHNNSIPLDTDFILRLHYRHGMQATYCINRGGLVIASGGSVFQSKFIHPQLRARDVSESDSDGA